jgi:hypothetical protein
MNAIATEDCDIFISYADPDDHLPAPRDRWVSRLSDDLYRAIRYLLKRDPELYFDEDCAEPNRDWNHIERLCTKARVFVAIASPNYLARDWPMRELNAYVAANKTLDGLFVVALSKLGKDAHPVLGPRTHLQCYPKDDRDTKELESAFPVPPDSPEFGKLVVKLATSIANYLKTLPASTAAPEPKAAAPKVEPAAKAEPKVRSKSAPAPRVLLAQCSDDLDNEYEAVRAFLEQMQIEVLPGTEYPRGGEEFSDAFAQDLAKATHFVQLLGPRPGRRPRDLPKGYVIHQADAALASKKPVLQWRGINWPADDAIDEDYVQVLKRETVIASTLEEFKSEVREMVTAPPKVDSGRKKGFVVFVNAELADRGVAEWLRAELSSDYSVFHPKYDVEGSNQDAAIEQLQDCRALLLLYGQAGMTWVNRQMLEAIKLRGDALPGGAVCMGPPTEKGPLNFSVPDIVELDCRNGDQWMIEPIRQRLAELSQ